MKIFSESEKLTKKAAKKLARFLRHNDVISLVGPLGAGKTIFVKGLAEGFNFDEDKVTSSSFIILQKYKTKKINLFHLDLYRLKKIEDLYNLGYEEFLFSDGITVIEWPQLMKKLLPEEYLEIKFSILTKNKRMLNFIGHGKRYKYIINKFN